MALAELLKPFQDEYENRLAKARERKKSGKKIVASFCTYTPEELLHAAGVLPWRIQEEGFESGGVENLVPGYVCNYIKKTVNFLKFEDLAFLDGYFFIHVCDALRGLFDVAHLSTGKYTEFLRYPFDCTSDSSLKFYYSEMQRAKANIEKFAGKQISAEELWKTIKLYNGNRRLLHQIYAMRSLDEPLLSGIEFYDIVMSAMTMPKEENNEMLKKFIEKIPKTRKDLGGKLRLFVSGSILEKNYLEIIEESGTVLVGDDLCYGSRYFHDFVKETNGDPLMALSERYLRDCQCSCKYTKDARMDKVVGDIVKTKAEAVIFAIQKYCEPDQFELPCFMDRIRDLGIPVLPLDVGESSAAANEQTRTRIEAFVEMCSQKQN